MKKAHFSVVLVACAIAFGVFASQSYACGESADNLETEADASATSTSSTSSSSAASADTAE